MISNRTAIALVAMAVACGGRSELDDGVPVVVDVPDAVPAYDVQAEASTADVHDAGSDVCYPAMQDCNPLACSILDPVTGGLVASYKCTASGDWSFFNDGGPPALVCTSTNPAPKLGDVCTLPDSSVGKVTNYYAN